MEEARANPPPPSEITGWDELETCWRNLLLNGEPCTYASTPSSIGFSPPPPPCRYSPNWRVPYSGTVEVDFVSTRKPTPADGPVATEAEIEAQLCDYDMSPLPDDVAVGVGGGGGSAVCSAVCFVSVSILFYFF
jgi:hypothetical protein